MCLAQGCLPGMPKQDSETGLDLVFDLVIREGNCECLAQLAWLAMTNMGIPAINHS